MYGRMVEAVAPFLRSKGLFVLSDITPSCYEGSERFLPQIMSDEIKGILSQGKCELVPIQPLSCAFWHDKCIGAYRCFSQKTFIVSHRKLLYGSRKDRTKVTFRVFANKQFAEPISNLLIKYYQKKKCRRAMSLLAKMTRALIHAELCENLQRAFRTIKMRMQHIFRMHLAGPTKIMRHTV
jgi:hypothetical protein